MKNRFSLAPIAVGAALVVVSSTLPAIAQTPPPRATPAPRATLAPRSVASPAVLTTPASRTGTPQTNSGTIVPPEPPVLPAVPDVAGGYSAPNAPLPNGDLVGINQQPFVGIKLDDAIGMALTKNTDLAISQSNQRIANYQIVAAKGAFDVNFELQPEYQHSVSPAISSFQSGPGGGPVTQDTVGATTAFTGITPAGQRYRIGGSAMRVQSNSSLNSYDPFYETAFTLNFTQPLLRGAGISDAKRALQLAAANAQVNTDVALANASQIVTNVSNTYWDLVAAWRNVAIQEEGLKEAQVQARSNQRLSSKGAVAPVDIVESTTQVNVFQDNVFSALSNVQRLQTQLKSLILANPGDPVWVANLVPTSAVLSLPAEPTLDDLIVSALRTRPEIAQLRAARLATDTNLAYAKNQLKPQLDLNLGASSNGFAGIPSDPNANPFVNVIGGQVQAINALITRANIGQPPANQIPLLGGGGFGAVPGSNVGRYGTAFTSAFQNKYPTYAISLTLKFPLQNRTAKADYAIADERAKQVAVQELTLLQRVRSEAVNALQQFRETQYRLVAASRARSAAERVLLAEQRRFSVGSSTTFLVLQRQLDVANNRGRELQAQTDLNKAVVELNRVSGGVFAQEKISAATLGSATLNASTATSMNLPPKK